MDNKERMDLYLNDLDTRRNKLATKLSELANDQTKSITEFINEMDETIDQINLIDIRKDFLKIAYDTN